MSAWLNDTTYDVDRREEHRHDDGWMYAHLSHLEKNDVCHFFRRLEERDIDGRTIGRT